MRPWFYFLKLKVNMVWTYWICEMILFFKAFFGDRRNNKLLLNFLRAILGEQIISVVLTNPYIEPSHANDKSSEMDLRILTNDGEQINVEMQLKGHKAFTERMLIYWAKMYGVQDKEVSHT